MKRMLYLDEDADNKEEPGMFVVSNFTDVEDLYNIEKIPAGLVVMDCRKLEYNTFFQLLPLIERYQGDITMLAKGALPRPILSRFSYKPPVEKLAGEVVTYKSLDEFIGSTITEELLEEITTAIKNEILSEIQCVIDANVKENTVSIKVTSGS